MPSGPVAVAASGGSWSVVHARFPIEIVNDTRSGTPGTDAPLPARTVRTVTSRRVRVRTSG